MQVEPITTKFCWTIGEIPLQFVVEFQKSYKKSKKLGDFRKKNLFACKREHQNWGGTKFPLTITIWRH